MRSILRSHVLRIVVLFPVVALVIGAAMTIFSRSATSQQVCWQPGTMPCSVCGTSMPPCLGVGCGTNFWGYPQCPSGTQQQFRPVPASSSTACCQDVPSGSANCQIVPQGGTLWCVQGQACNTNSNQCVWVEEVGYECQAYGDISNVCGLTVGYIQTSGSCPTGQ